MVGYIGLKDLDSVFEFDLEPTVYSSETIRKLNRLSQKRGKPAAVHLKIETGTNRQGVDQDHLEKVASVIKNCRGIRLRGISTHFANIEDTTDHSFANRQLRLFNRLVARLAELDLKADYRHTACSAALLLFEETKFEMVRPGIAVYGLWPSKETYLSYRLQGGSNDILSPLLTWKTRIIQIKNVPPDAFIGYGCTYRTTSSTRLALLPIGYYDGYGRSLSNLAHVLIKGRRAPIRGRICMNLVMADITDIKGVRLEDEVVLLGRSMNETISADQMAEWANTVNYEVVSRINGKIPRIII
jgi:alanine racemase